MAVSVTKVKRRIVGRLVVELDDTGRFEVKGHTFMLLAFPPNTEMIPRVAEMARQAKRAKP